MPLEPLFGCLRSLVHKQFAKARSDAGEKVAGVILQIEEEPDGGGQARAEFVAYEQSKRVRATWNGVASLWALTQGAARLSRRMFEGKRSGQKRLEIGSDPELEQGLDALELARRLCTQDIPVKLASLDQWPTWAPQITASPESGSDNAIGLSFFLGALGFIFRHELAHIALNHDSRQVACEISNIECEREADFEAAKWLKGFLKADLDRPLGKPGEEELKLERRALCVGCGLIWVALFESDQYRVSTDHPPVAERLFTCLEKLELGPDSAAAEILSDIVQAWIDPEGTWTTGDAYPDAQAGIAEAVYRLQRFLMYT